MSLHNTHISHEGRDKTHIDQVHNVVATSQHDIVLPKLTPTEHKEHQRHSDEVNNDGDSLFRFFKDQKTIDILRHMNIN